MRDGLRGRRAEQEGEKRVTMLRAREAGRLAVTGGLCCSGPSHQAGHSAGHV